MHAAVYFDDLTGHMRAILRCQQRDNCGHIGRLTELPIRPVQMLEQTCVSNNSN